MCIISLLYNVRMRSGVPCASQKAEEMSQSDSVINSVVLQDWIVGVGVPFRPDTSWKAGFKISSA